MSRFYLLLFFTTASASNNATRANSTQSKQPQHVLFILVDDLGWSDVSYHGKDVNSKIKTPTIDDLSGKGVRLENYYVAWLCSPTRASLLSGRYPYSIGMSIGITDQGPGCLPRSVSTFADRLQGAGWATAAFGKWNAGFSSWGCTPTCRGFQHFYGFYKAANDYYTHKLGGLDFRNGTEPVTNLNGSYFTDLVTQELIRWVSETHLRDADRPTFAYLAHQAVHSPLQVPDSYIRESCLDIPKEEESRRIYCGMVLSVDDSLKSIMDAYTDLGIWENTVVFFSTDNGGDAHQGGNNHPLRGQKGTAFEGGIRAVGWVSGGWPQVRRATTSHAMIHVSDWYPTIVEGIAGLEVNVGKDGSPPLDGKSAWDAIILDKPSMRTEMLLNLMSNPRDHQQMSPGQGAIRVGRWKLLHGYTSLPFAMDGWKGSANCYSRDETSVPSKFARSSFCPNGWLPPPESSLLPMPPPDTDGADCKGSVPCTFNASPLIHGGTLLFNIEADPNEAHNVIAEHPDIAEELLARLQSFNDTGPPQEQHPLDPVGDPSKFYDVVTPWTGNTDPTVCDWTFRTALEGMLANGTHRLVSHKPLDSYSSSIRWQNAVRSSSSMKPWGEEDDQDNGTHDAINSSSGMKPREEEGKHDDGTSDAINKSSSMRSQEEEVGPANILSSIEPQEDQFDFGKLSCKLKNLFTPWTGTTTVWDLMLQANAVDTWWRMMSLWSMLRSGIGVSFAVISSPSLL